MTLPALRPHPSTTSRPAPSAPRWLKWCGLALLAALALPFAASTDDLAGSQSAGERLRAAMQGMTEAVGRLEPPVHNRVAADVYLMAQSIGQALRTLEAQPVPVAEPGLSHDLDYLRDIVLATTTVVEAASESSPGAVAPLAGEVERLSDAAAARLERIEATLADWRLRTQGAVIEVEAGPEVVVVRSIDRWLYDAVRYGGVALFLIGLLVLGLRLLALGETELGLLDLLRQAPAVTVAGLAIFTLFMGGAVVLATAPGLVVGRSAETVVLTREPPCRILAVQRSDLWAAEEIDSERLVDAVKARMLPTARDCMGLDSEQVAAAAVERFAARRPAADAAATAVAAAPAGTRPPASMQRLENEIDQLLAALRSIVPDLAETRATLSDDGNQVVAEGEEPVAEGDQAGGAAAANAEGAGTPAGEETASAAAENDDDLGQGGEFVPVSPNQAPREVVTTAGVNFRAGPSVDAPRLGALPEGSQVRFLGEERGWTHIQLADGRDAYVASSFLRPAP
jgi:hypothetical protein